MSRHAVEAEILERICESQRIQSKLGMVDFLGHTSGRLPGGRFAIKPKFSTHMGNMDTIHSGDLLILDSECEVVEGAGRPPAEVWIHAELYRMRPDVGAVIHTHQPMATHLGIMGGEVLPILHIEGASLDGQIAIWDCPLLVSTRALAESLVASLDGRGVCLMRGHGVTVAGTDVESATVAAIQLERLCEANLVARSLGGTPRVLSAEEIRALKTEMGPTEARWSYYLNTYGRLARSTETEP